jgi:hypothetical protein
MEQVRTQDQFTGGLNLFTDSTRTGENEYPYLQNGRTRFGKIKPTKLPVDVSAGLPEGGAIQGGVSVGGVLLVFVAGNAYARDLAAGQDSFNALVDFPTMDPAAECIFMQPVDASTTNYTRASVDGMASSGINLVDRLTASPQCIVCQDGVNQPVGIFPDLSTRVLNTYAQWDKAVDREYVPVGKQMLYSDGVLYIVSPDGREIFRTVSGRPLDSMIVVKTDGDKLPTEEEGGVSNTSIKVDYGVITCLGRLDTENGSFFVGTETASYLVIPDLTRLVWAEPLFIVPQISSKGVVNHFSFSQLSGNTTFITSSGIESFNAIARQNREGSVAEFSVKLSSLIEDVVQMNTCIGRLNSYYFYSLDTVYGSLIAVYDNLLNTFVSLDIYPNLAAVKRFINVKVNSQEKLFAISTTGQLVEMFAGATAECKFSTGEWTQSSLNSEVSCEAVTVSFHKVFETGIVGIKPYVDGVGLEQRTETVTGEAEEAVPKTPPFGNDTTKAARVRKIKFDDLTTKGRRVGATVSWSFDGELSAIQLDTMVEDSGVTEDDRLNSCMNNKTALGV